MGRGLDDMMGPSGAIVSSCYFALISPCSWAISILGVVARVEMDHIAMVAYAGSRGILPGYTQVCRC